MSLQRFERKASETGLATLESVITAQGSAVESPAKPEISFSNDVRANAAEVTVKGKVVDERGDALPGVSVVVKGSQRGVITDMAGRYVDFRVDFGLFQNRLQVSLDYYKGDSKDLLLDVKLPVSTGLGDVYNDASMVQPMRSTRALKRPFPMPARRAISVTAFLPIRVSTRIMSCRSATAPPIVSGATNGGINITKTDVGAAIGSFYGFRVDHVVSSDAEVARYNEGAIAKCYKADQDGLKAGDIIYKDLNGDGQITDSDQSFLGSAIPVWTYGGSMNLSYKTRDLSMGLAGIGAVKVYNALRHWTEGTTRPVQFLHGRAECLEKGRRYHRHAAFGPEHAVEPARFRPLPGKRLVYAPA